MPISAVDSVAPAIARTREFLFSPFKWGTYLKLGLVAIITEGVGSNFNVNHTQHGAEHVGAPNFAPFHLAPEGIAIAAAAVALAAVVSLFIFYLITRLRFAFFHALVHNIKEIRPGWHLYRDQASRFFWLNIVVGVCFVLVIVALAIPFAALLWRVIENYHSAGHLDVGWLLALVLPLIPVIILLVIAGILSDLILRDGMMPHMALENATAGEAWRQVRMRIGAEKRQFAVYAILRVILPAIASIAVLFVIAIPGLMAAGSIAAIEWGVHSVFAGTTGASWFVGVALEVFFGVIAFGFALLASICLGGPLSTGTREYALIFYGGRYKALGDILYPAKAIAGSASGTA